MSPRAAIGLLAALLAAPAFAQGAAGDTVQDIASVGERGASASAPSATDLYEAGRKAWLDGDHDQAITLLERAWAALHEPTFLFNIGVVLEESGRYEEALDAYRRYVTESNDGEGIGQAVERMEATREKFGKGRLTIRADGSDAAVFVDGADIGWAPLERLLVSAGPHRVRVESPGAPPLDLVATVLSGETRELAVNLRPAPASADVMAQGTPAPADDQLQTWGIAVAATGGAALTAGIVLVAVGEDSRDGGYDGSGDLERAIGIGLTTAGALTATAGVLMAVLSEDDEPAPAAWVAPAGLGGLAVGGSF